MKTRIILIFGILLFSCAGLTAQISESDIPQDVFISFKYKYPDATVSKWDSLKGNFLAEFTLNDQEGSAEFTPGGKWVKTSFIIAEKELPSPILKYIKTNYPDHSIRESSFEKDPEKSDIYCIVLKEQGIKDQVALYFDIEGKLLKKVDNQEARADKVQKETEKKEHETRKGKNSEVQETSQQPVVKKDEGEPVEDSKVPANAKTYLTTKYKKASEVKWYREEKNYVAHFFLTAKKGKSVFSEEGNWKETRIEQDPLTLPALMQNYLKSNFRKFRIVSADFVQMAPKSKFYEILLVEKSSKLASPPVTKVFFDGNGKFQSVERPEVEETNDNAGKDQEEADKEFMASVDASNQAIETGTGVNDAVSPKELPTDAINLIKKQYPEHKIKTCRYLFDDDLNTHVYYVTVKKEGDKYEIELYFNLEGKLLKKVDPTEQKYQKETTGEGEKPVKEQTNIENSVDEMISGGAENINPKELPSGITNYVKKNFPEFKIEKALYTTDEEFGNVYYLQLKKAGEKIPTELWFDLNGKLVKSKIQGKD